jgi:hypothetical protein
VEQRKLLNPVTPDAVLANVQTAFVSATPPGGWPAYLTSAFQDEQQRLATSLAGTAEQFMRDFPAKTYYTLAAAKLEVTPNALVRIISQALKLSDDAAQRDHKLMALRDSLIAAWGSSMWPQLVQP